MLYISLDTEERRVSRLAAHDYPYSEDFSLSKHLSCRIS